MKRLEVEIYRGKTLESRHQVMALAVGAKGEIHSQYGRPADLAMPVFPRSAIKPLQAMLFVESGAWEAFGLEEKHLVLAAASHQGEKMHLDLVQEWMKRVGVQESDFACGGHWPGHFESQFNMIRAGVVKPSSSVNNCSGKHLGLLTTCQHLGYPMKGYDQWDHPLQKDLRKLLSGLTGEDLNQAPWGVDGCGIPTLAFPLKGLALGMSHLLAPKDSIQKIIKAIQKYPELIGGSEDFTSKVIAASQGKALIKTGAEGVFAGVVFSQGIGFAVKALDGHSRASQAVTAYLLKKWGSLIGWENPPIVNWKGDVVGSIQVVEKEERL